MPTTDTADSKAATPLNREKTNELGFGLCSVPMWCNGMPAGFCDAPAFGERPTCREWRNAYTGEYHRTDGRYGGYVPALACVNHGGPATRVFMDGDAWCAVEPDFVDLQQSLAGFGPTPEAARAFLAGASAQQKLAKGTT